MPNSFKNIIDRFISRLKTSQLIQKVVILAGGFFLGQLISIIASPIITRIYTPEEFGIFSIFSSILTSLTVIAALRYELAIPLPNKASDAHTLLLISTLILVILTVFSMIITWIIWYSDIVLFGNTRLNNYLLLLPIGFFFSGLFLIFNHWAILKQEYNTISTSKVYQVLSGVSIQILLGISGFNALGLIIGSILKQVAGFLKLFKLYWRDRDLYFTPQKHDLKRILYKYKKFPLFSSWSAFINVIGLNIPVLLIAQYYNPETAGLFSLSLLVINIPITTIGKGVAQVFLGTSGTILTNNPIRFMLIYKKLLITLFKIGIIPALIIAFKGEAIFSLIFGQDWQLTGTITQIMAFVYLMQFSIVPLSHLLTILNRQGVQLLWDIFRLILIVGSFTVTYYLEFSFIHSIIVFAIALAIAYMSLFLIHIYFLRQIELVG